MQFSTLNFGVKLGASEASKLGTSETSKLGTSEASKLGASEASKLGTSEASKLGTSEASIRTTKKKKEKPAVLQKPESNLNRSLIRPRAISQANQMLSNSLQSAKTASTPQEIDAYQQTGRLMKQPMHQKLIKLPDSFELKIVHCFPANGKTFSYVVHSSLENERETAIIQCVEVELNDFFKNRPIWRKNTRVLGLCWTLMDR